AAREGGGGGGGTPADQDDPRKGARLHPGRRARRGDAKIDPAAQDAARSERSQARRPGEGSRNRVIVSAGMPGAPHISLSAALNRLRRRHFSPALSSIGRGSGALWCARATLIKTLTVR